MEPGVVGDCTLWDGLQALWDGIFRQRSLRRAGRRPASPASAAHLKSHEPVLKPPVGESHNVSAAARKIPISAHWNGQKRLGGW